VTVAGLYLNKIDVADLARKLRNAGMSEYADRIEDAYKEGTRLFHISTSKLTAFFVAVDG
jgi:isocitrate lyase